MDSSEYLEGRYLLPEERSFDVQFLFNNLTEIPYRSRVIDTGPNLYLLIEVIQEKKKWPIMLIKNFIVNNFFSKRLLKICVLFGILESKICSFGPLNI